MRIATWNLRHPPISENERKFAIQYYIAHVNADIWVLTETHCCFSPGFGYKSVSSEPDHDSHTDLQRWTMIWSRYPIKRLARTSDPGFAVAAMVQPANGKPLLVYGIVLPWASIKNRNGGDAYLKALAAQANDWKVLRTNYPQVDLCVAGDFNQTMTKTSYYPMGENHSALTKSLLDNNLTVLTVPNDPVKYIEPARASIDHICISIGSPRLPAKSVIAWDKKTKEGVILSDHFGVYADLADA